ncbi:hypothetical protein LEP1GSC061_0522 [Leptospira wolffii serovar Khorat str. Khorat-H2]|nr:hypothetical protein LEP1GSC061_0522 [Leptospira wolffii serovar Khorat str. Khorat-H2]
MTDGRKLVFSDGSMEQNRIYNYFYTFEEFFQYLKGKRYLGEGMSSFADPEVVKQCPKTSLVLDPQKGITLKFKSGDSETIRETADWNDTDWTRKEDWFVWIPNQGEEISLQALDSERIHLYWKASQDILFSGILDSRRKSFRAELVQKIKNLFRSR